MTTPPDSQAYKDALSRFASGVTVVLVPMADGTRVGKTISSFISLSIEPLMVGFAINQNSPFIENLKQAESFSISILAADQQGWAKRFAAHGPVFAEAAELSASGHVPGALAELTCHWSESWQVGDHVMVAAKVTAAGSRTDQPLAYWLRQFRRPDWA